MKHLKKFENSSTRKELEEFCKNYLAGMFDNSRFNLEVSESNDSYIIAIEPVGLIRWVDIKDEFIPFLGMLDREYSIHRYESGFGNGYIRKMRIGNAYYSISSILADDIDGLDYLYLLYIAVDK